MMKSIFVWILVSAVPGVAPVYSLPVVSETDCQKLYGAIVSYETRRYSKCVRVAALID